MPNKNACLVCLRFVNKNPGLSLFGFSKDPKRLKIWLIQCDLNASDILPSRKICSFHFASTDFGKGIKRKSLKSDAIPTIFEKNHKAFIKKYEMPFKSFKEIPDIVNLPETPKDEEMVVVLEEPHCSYNLNSNITPTKVPLEHNGLTAIIETPKNLKRKRKSYIGDVKTPDLATPRKAKKHFNLAKLKIIKQTNKIRQLHQTVRRLRKKLTSLNKLIDHLKNKNLISEQAHDEILV